jgi:5'(3')-deoxyribonucleotidase
LATNQVKYCIDTCAIVDAGERYYPIDIFPSFWQNLDALAQSGRLKAPEMLITELAQKTDSWRDWVYLRSSNILIPHDRIFFAHVKNIVSIYEQANNGQFNIEKIGGDPFFIAFAKQHNLTLITVENSRPGGFRIPSISKQAGVKTINLLGLNRSEGWTF